MDNNTENDDKQYDIRAPLQCGYLTLSENKFPPIGDDVPFKIQPDYPEEFEMTVPVLVDKICVFPGQILPIMGNAYNPRCIIKKIFYQSAFEHNSKFVGIIPYSKYDNHCDHKRGALFKIIGYCNDDENYFSVKLVCCYLFKTKDCINSFKQYPINIGKIDIQIEYENLDEITVDIMNGLTGSYYGSQFKIFRNNQWPDLIEKMKEYIRNIGLNKKDIDQLFAQSPCRISYYFIECIIVSYEEKVQLFNATIEGRIISGLRYIDNFEELRCKTCDYKLPYNDVQLMCITGIAPYFFNREGYFFRTLCMKTFETEDHYEPYDCWFPDYGWYIRYCDQCTNHLGWLYKHNEGKNPQVFAGLAMNKICIKREVVGKLVDAI